MKLNKVCFAQPGHVKFIKSRKAFPVVVSAKRFDAIMDRSRMEKKHAALAAEEEEKRYMNYLKEGSDWLCSRFTKMSHQDLDKEKQAKLDQELKEAAIREKQVKYEDDLNRKKRIFRANRILENMKENQRALHRAVVESEVIYQRKYNEAVDREIAEDARRQKRLEDEICPEVLIPLSNITEEQLKAQEKAKAMIMRAEFLKDCKERRERKLAEKEQEECDVLIERAQYQCLYEKEQKEAKERAEKKREFCRRAYKDALKEKAAIKEYERICDKITDRIICADVTRRRTLDTRYNKDFKANLAKRIRDRENRAIQICRLHQENKRQAQDHERQVGEQYDTEVLMDEGRRQCEINELSRQRRAYELEERRQAEKRRERDAEIRRFQVANRLKNMETNRRFCATQKRHKDQATANLRGILFGQRDDFLERRQRELMQISSCQADPYIKEDAMFFDDALKAVVHARKTGRPVFPMAKAVEIYTRKNQIDKVPESRMVGRSRIRDYCWPGYHSKADLAYKTYAQREKCREDLQYERNQIFDKCIKITKIAAEEQPYKKCELECPMKCFQHRGMPAVESIDSFECGSNVCYEEDLQPGQCPIAMQVAENCDESLRSNRSADSIEAHWSSPDLKESPLSSASSMKTLGGVHRCSSNEKFSKTADRKRIWR
ncbi:axoneme-associated protein mst101(2)-like [Drosophila novamexicana]|uniref:axoneme-associated protein mst101(2)-like n=1 Tax=Drosophila novamexicana TaxID=47314 RepID=UPI0011E5DC78|nr:axoneme-associated protein mst101(2)-like [Drosophila novamexicana]